MAKGDMCPGGIKPVNCPHGQVAAHSVIKQISRGKITSERCSGGKPGVPCGHGSIDAHKE